MWGMNYHIDKKDVLSSVVTHTKDKELQACLPGYTSGIQGWASRQVPWHSHCERTEQGNTGSSRHFFLGLHNHFYKEGVFNHNHTPLCGQWGKTSEFKFKILIKTQKLGHRHCIDHGNFVPHFPKWNLWYTLTEIIFLYLGLLEHSAAGTSTVMSTRLFHAYPPESFA